eukprot:29418-Prymnesium_polylepis.1
MAGGLHPNPSPSPFSLHPPLAPPSPLAPNMAGGLHPNPSSESERRANCSSTHLFWKNILIEPYVDFASGNRRTACTA